MATESWVKELMLGKLIIISSSISNSMVCFQVLQDVMNWYSSQFVRVVCCTRWSELTETLRFHINAAHSAGAPTEFRLLNGGFFSYLNWLYSYTNTQAWSLTLIISLANFIKFLIRCCPHIDWVLFWKWWVWYSHSSRSAWELPGRRYPPMLPCKRNR